MTGERKVLLWIDNDGPDFFLSEGRKLKRLGWDVQWCLTLEDSAARLENPDRIDVILLDQGLPYSASYSSDMRAPEGPPWVWGGCRLLYWLRGKGRPEKMPIDANDLDVELTVLAGSPAVAHTRVPVVFVTAIWNPSVLDALRNVIGTQDFFRVRKPIVWEELLRQIAKAEEKTPALQPRLDPT